MSAEFGPRDTKFAIFQGSPLTPPGGKVGGAEFVVHQQSRHLSNERSVGIISPHPETNGIPLEIPKSLHVELFKSPKASNNDELLDQLKQSEWVDYFSRVLNGTRPGEGILYGHYYVAGGVVAEMRDRLHRQFVYMGHSWDRIVKEMDPDRHITATRDEAEQKILRSTDAIIVSTNAEKAALAQLYSDVLPSQQIANKTFVVNLGTDLEQYNPETMGIMRKYARTQLLPTHLQDPDNLVFYTLGRMSSQKAHVEAMKGFAEMYSQNPHLKVSLSLIGGPLEGNSYYEKEVQPFLHSLPEHIQHRIVIHGRQAAELAHAMGDVFVGATRWETWFLVLTEAMAAGKPAFVSNKPILREVAGEHIPTVNEDDPSSIATTMYTLATDKQYRESVAHEAWVRGQQYTWRASVAGLSSVLDNLQNGGKSLWQ